VGLEFEFVSSQIQSQGADPSLPNRAPYLPTNLAFQGATITEVGTTTYFNGSELNDEDFCCAIQGSNQGNRCGVIFSTSDTDAEIQMVLDDGSSYVNEIVTSWYDPCRNLPENYNLYYANGSTTSWKLIHTFQTTGNSSSCFSMQGMN
jgi:hypothetical protein